MGQSAPSALRPTAGFCPRIPGELLNKLEGHTSGVDSRGVTSVCVTADGETVVSGSYDTTVRLWRQLTGVCLCARLPVGPFRRGPTRAATEERARRSSRVARVGTHGNGRRWARCLMMGPGGKGEEVRVLSRIA